MASGLLRISVSVFSWNDLNH